MKKAGIIGGAGPLASALLYELVIEECYHHKKNIPAIPKLGKIVIRQLLTYIRTNPRREFYPMGIKY